MTYPAEIVYENLPVPIYTTRIRYHPTEFTIHMSAKVDIKGC